jgi:hypothetical protein
VNVIEFGRGKTKNLTMIIFKDCISTEMFQEKPNFLTKFVEGFSLQQIIKTLNNIIVIKEI